MEGTLWQQLPRNLAIDPDDQEFIAVESWSFRGFICDPLAGFELIQITVKSEGTTDDDDSQ